MTEQIALSILEAMPDVVVALDRDWRYSYVNAAAERLLGHPRQEILGQMVWDSLPRGLGQESLNACSRAVAENVVIRCPEYLSSLLRWFDEAACPLAGGVFLFARDITESKTAEIELRKSEERLRGYFELGLTGAAITSPSKGILEVNSKICHILGYSREELLRSTWAELTHSDDLDADLAQYNRVLAGEIDGYLLDKRWVRKDGRTVESAISVMGLRCADGKVDCFVALLQDLSERRQAEQDRERLALLVENSSDFIGICDMNFAPYFVNRAGLQMVGLDNREEAFRKSIYEFLFPEDVPFVRDEFLPRVLREGRGKMEVRFRHFKTGEALWMIYSLLLIRDRHGTPTGLATISLNITERRLTEDKLRRAHDELELRVCERTRDLQAANEELRKEIRERERVEKKWRDVKSELAADLDAMSRLNELNKRYFAADGLEALLKELLHATIQLQRADFGAVQMYNPRDETLQMVAHFGLSPEFLEQFATVAGDGGAYGRSLQQRTRVVIADVQEDPAFEAHRQVAANAGIRAVHCTPLFTSAGEPLGVVSAHFRHPHSPSELELRLTDLYARQAAQIIERQRVEEALRRSEAYLSMGQRISHTGSVSLNFQTGEVFWTDEAFRIYGLSPNGVKPSGDLFCQAAVHPEDQQRLGSAFEQAIRNRGQYDLQFRIIRPDGTVRYVRGVGEPIYQDEGVAVGIIGAVMDTTEQKLAADALHKAQSELVQIARATTVGALAASIAHEANQPIAAIVSNGEACLKWLNRPEPNWTEAQAAAERMIAEGHRASAVIGKVRSLMKQAPIRMLTLDLNELVGEVLVLMYREIVSNAVSLRTDLAKDLPLVFGDRVHLQQVFVNLLMNAIEATSGQGEGARDCH